MSFRLLLPLVLGVGLVTGGLARAAKPPEQSPFAHPLLGVRNGCFVETVAWLDRWQEKFGADAWSRMLQWGAKEDEEVVAGHAVGLGEFRGALWAWDSNFGWSKLAVSPEARADAAALAKPVTARYPRVSPRFPTLRHDFPQRASASIPDATTPTTNAAWRDARVVAAALARHRPVNLVKFAFTAGEEKRESAAVVFQFHGRYCVYVPEMGTVPFRVKTNVENLRIIQELLRRAFPGVTGVQKM